MIPTSSKSWPKSISPDVVGVLLEANPREPAKFTQRLSTRQGFSAGLLRAEGNPIFRELTSHREKRQRLSQRYVICLPKMLLLLTNHPIRQVNLSSSEGFWISGRVGKQVASRTRFEEEANMFSHLTFIYHLGNLQNSFPNKTGSTQAIGSGFDAC